MKVQDKETNKSRRDFLKTTSLASLTIFPVTKTLANALQYDEAAVSNLLAGNFNSELEFHVVDNNLLNLHFYFINTERHYNYIRSKDERLRSFMIIRLPQMHVSEKGYWEQNKKDIPAAKLSGYSYLAFHLWPDAEAKKDKTRRKDKAKRFKFNLETILDWNNENHFDLITLVEWFKLKGTGKRELDYRECGEFKDNKAWQKVEAEIDTKFNDSYYIKNSREPQSLNYKKYKSQVRHFLDFNFEQPNSQYNQFIPISFLEIPQGLCLVPVYGKRDKNGELIKMAKKFWPNNFVNQSSADEGDRKYEVWNNTLFFRRELQEAENGAKKTYTIEAPSFRAIGIISDETIFCPHQYDCTNTTSDRNTLPTLLDKAELTFLTQFAKGKGNNPTVDFRGAEFDIVEMNGLFLTGLGVITHLKYYNVENKPVGTDLIEYEHRITQGRDVFIKVSRLGYNTKTGQKYKHVIEGRRKISLEKMIIDGKVTPQPVSFIELKQYCECIDQNISYTLFDDVPTQQSEVAETAWYKEMKKGDFVKLSGLGIVKNDIIEPALADKTIGHYRRLPYQSLSVVEKKRIPIMVLRDKIQPPDLCTLEGLGWFWPIVETNKYNDTNTDKDVALEDYLHCEYEAIDWDGKTIKAKTPFMFIRASLIETNDNKPLELPYQNYFYGGLIKTAEDKNQIASGENVFFERRKTQLNNQKIAFTPSDQNRDKTQSKVNIIETEFIETFFMVRQRSNSAPMAVQKIPYAVFPQQLRMAGFTDHLKDLIGKKIIQVMEYHDNYVLCGFNQEFDFITVAGEKTKNYGKQILANTDAFILKKEIEAQNKYKEISDTLKESKNRLGNLVVPDIIPNTVSIEKFGMTLQKNIDESIRQGKTIVNNVYAGLQSISNLSPREFLKDMAEICGLDLAVILDELIPAEEGNNHTPLFEINKILNKIEGEVLNSPVYKKIIDFKITDPLSGDALHPLELIRRYDEKISEFTNALEQARLAVNDAVKKLSSEIPNAEELDNLVKALFEQYRTKATQLLLDNVPFKEVKGKIDATRQSTKEFFDNEKLLLTQEFNANREKVKLFLSDVKAEIGQLPADLRSITEESGLIISIESYLSDKIGSYYSGTVDAFFNTKLGELYDTITEDTMLQVDSDKIYYISSVDKAIESVTYELTKDSAKGSPLYVFPAGTIPKLIQLNDKINTLRSFVIQNVSGNEFQRKASTVLQAKINEYVPVLDGVAASVRNFQDVNLNDYIHKIADWKKRADQYLLNNPNTTVPVKNAIIKIQGVMATAYACIDFLRKLDPYFYYTQQQRLTKEIQDIEKRFKQKYHDHYANVKLQVETLAAAYKVEEDKYAKTIENAITATGVNVEILQRKLNEVREIFMVYRTNEIIKINDKSREIISKLIQSPEFAQLKEIYEAFNKAKQIAKDQEDKLNQYLQNYKVILQQQASDFATQLDQKVSMYIEELEDDLIDAVGADNILEIESEINEAKNIYKLLTSIKQQELTYNWNTDKFHDINLGIVTFKKFSNPNTKLSVDVKATTYFSSGKFPPAIEKVVAYSENRFTNFGINFFNCLTVNFNEITFISGSDHPTHFDVKIKDVKFDGALSFVQAFESWLKTMGKGLILQLNGDHVALGYSLPIPAISTPGFNIFNLSLNLDLRVYFDNRPLRFGFSLARPDSKFGIAVGIYAGFGFFSVVADPKKGIVEIDCALEAGAWAGISIGPFSGEVKLAFGFRYTKNQFGVRLEGYIVAEGRLSVWVIEISARIYLGVVSVNSYVEGVCTVTHSVKLGFIKRSFSASYHKKIAGAASNNNEQTAEKIVAFHLAVSKSFNSNWSAYAYDEKNTTKLKARVSELLEREEEEGDELETKPVSAEAWKRFITTF